MTLTRIILSEIADSMIWFLFQGDQGPIGKHGSVGFTGDRVSHVTNLLVGSFFLLVCYSLMFFLISLFVHVTFYSIVCLTSTS